MINKSDNRRSPAHHQLGKTVAAVDANGHCYNVGVVIGVGNFPILEMLDKQGNRFDWQASKLQDPRYLKHEDERRHFDPYGTG